MESAELAYYEAVDINKTVKLTYGTRKETTYFGVGALASFGEALETLGINACGFVTYDPVYKDCGAWAIIEPILKERNVDYLMFDKVMTNPTTEIIDECRDMFRERYNHQFCIVAIGGGSPIDTAKSVAVLLEHGEKNAEQLYRKEFEAERRAPLMAVNITAGTGSEVDKFAVASILHSEPPLKPVIGTPVIYPDISFDDPSMLLSTPDRITACTALDAVNHVTEASTTTIATPFSVHLARAVCSIVAHYLPVALKDPTDLRARYWLMYASSIAGMSFNESMLHITHALEHTLSAYVTDFTHGLGLALLQPGVVAHIWSDELSAKTLSYVLKPIIGKFHGKAKEAHKVSKALRKFHESVGIKDTMATAGFAKDGIEKLVDSTFACPGMTDLLALAPVAVTNETLKDIYLTGFFDE
ncbi:Iron-containing alcohol dehydrogenase [Carpediemonas membranifera]|uniref:Iron-containing alcohol dehydrogenase n=1 Tax=Carpediemonas membranifera TaxID=201153 RepID=A0A8J6B109_9EUKA|nr:Iron-containing alcohol dehydrogenase [Carpediemonas membranifera]|eukprot:KAG9390644.1 Iron-containing alcohol dehydrogenase [Carpediemonas membranifera]